MTSPAHVFELVAGHPALDFLNTVSDWTVDSPRDYLASPHDAVRFGVEAGVLSRSEGKRLAALLDAAELRQLVRLRQAAANVVRSLLHDVPLERKQLGDIDEWRRAAAAATRARLDHGRVIGAVPLEVAGGRTLRLRLVTDLLDLLASDRVSRLRLCPRCGWFLLDTTKNGSRRWCSMQMCGSREKSRRHYWKSRV